MAMFDKLMSALGIENSAADNAAITRANENRRGQPRRNCDQCIAEIEGLNYPIEDWSPGGVRIFCDSRVYQIGQTMPITMKFRMQERILRVTHTGTVVRKGNDTVALAFTAPPPEVKQQFQLIIDDFNVRELANSQVY